MIRINFKSVLVSVFAQYETTDEIKNVANDLCAQIKEVYEARFNEIKGTKRATAPATEASSKKTATAKAKTATEKPKKTEAPKAETKTSEPDSDTLIAITDTAAIKKLGLTFTKYNDRCWALRGNTKPLRKILKEQFKGVFNSHLSGGEGWVIKTSSAQECADALGIKVKVA